VKLSEILNGISDLKAKGNIDILISTTVIEVGVDVKNATVMVIFDADRFGLSTLHQLRGRVGRGEKEGYCYLLTDSKDKQALEKLNVLVDNTDGFKISYYDLMLRGPGDILGIRQAGLPTFSLGNVINDNDLLIQSRNDAIEIINYLDNYPLIKIIIYRSFFDSSAERVIPSAASSITAATPHCIPVISRPMNEI